MNYCFGVDIGGTTVKIGLFSLDGTLMEKWEIPTRKEDSGSHILPDVADSILKKMESNEIEKEVVVGIGVGVPGPVTASGVVLKCVNLGWGIFDVAEEVVKLTGIENVKVANDANVAALGEMWKGGGKGYKNLVMLTLGTGVGGGIILDGKIVSGANGAAGELGHIKVNPKETKECGCKGKGCVEQYASATGIVNEAKKCLASTDRPSRLRNAKHISAKMVFDAAKDNDEVAQELVEQLGAYLGTVCGHISCVVDPEVFVIGGGVSKAGTILTDVIKKNYEKNVMFAHLGKEFRLAELENDAGIFGSARMVIDINFDNGDLI